MRSVFSREFVREDSNCLFVEWSVRIFFLFSSLLRLSLSFSSSSSHSSLFSLIDNSSCFEAWINSLCQKTESFDSIRFDSSWFDSLQFSSFWKRLGSFKTTIKFVCLFLLSFYGWFDLSWFKFPLSRVVFSCTRFCSEFESFEGQMWSLFLNTPMLCCDFLVW